MSERASLTQLDPAVPKMNAVETNAVVQMVDPCMSSAGVKKIDADCTCPKEKTHAPQVREKYRMYRP